MYGDDFAIDEIGLDLPDIDAALAEAKQSAADILREAMKDRSKTGRLAIALRSGSTVVALVQLTFEAHIIPLPSS